MTRAPGTPIVLERVFDRPPAAVFAAWSDPASVSQWMAPGDGFGPADVEIDFRVGGRFRIAMHGPGGEFVQHGAYLEIDPPKRLAFTWVSEWLPASEAATRVTVTLEPEGADRTRLRLVHDALPHSSSYDGHSEGWAAILGHLERALGADPAEPDSGGTT